MIPQEIVDKIEKLLALKDNAGATQAESENAAAKIQAILMKHNLDMQQVQKQMGKEDPKVGHCYVDLTPYQGKTDANYVFDLLTVIARNNLCEAIGTREPGISYTKTAILVGDQDNCDMVVHIVISLRNQIVDAEKKAYKIYTGEITNRNTYKRGYYRGAVHGINSKLKQATEELKQIEEGMGLMIINKLERVNSYIDQTFSLKSAKPKRGLTGRDGYTDGYSDGRNMNAHKGIS
jgi:hypothetical protein